MLKIFGFQKSKEFDKLYLSFFKRHFARKITYTGSDLFGYQKTIKPSPIFSPAQEFDAHRYKMRTKYENRHERQWYNKMPARSIFRYDPEFPDFYNDYDPIYQKNEDEMLKNIQTKYNRFHDKRMKDHLKLINVQEEPQKNYEERLRKANLRFLQEKGLTDKEYIGEDKPVNLDDDSSVIEKFGWNKYREDSGK